jgi:hypothetical protein
LYLSFQEEEAASFDMEVKVEFSSRFIYGLT